MPRKNDGARTDPRWRSYIEPAPGELRIVQALINTAAVGREELANPGALTDWSKHWGLLSRGSETTAEDLEQILQVRSDLLALVRAGRSRSPAPEVIVSLNRAAKSSPIRVHINSDGSCCREPMGEGVFEILGRLFDILYLARHDQRWERLKLCQRQDCGAAFYDFSHGMNGKWCSARCGDRLKSRTYRDRRKRYRARARENPPLAT